MGGGLVPARKGEGVTGAALHVLARTYGIEGEYHDIWGQRHLVGDDTKRALLAAMGVSAGDSGACERALEEARVQRWRRVIEPVLVARESESVIGIDVRLPDGTKPRLRWSLTLEDGRGHSGDIDMAQLVATDEEAQFEGRKFRRCRFDLPVKPALGYHTLQILGDSPEGAKANAMRLVVVPDACHRPEAIAEQRRAWGLQVQLYALRSRRNWGMGDFTDLRVLVDICAEAGAGVVALNPLHALYPCNPAHASPYSPSSRLFGNVLYLDVEAIPEFGQCESAKAAVGAPRFQERLNALRAAEMVDYPAVAQMKFSVLELLYRDFRERHLECDSPRAEVFRAFRTRGGGALRRHCIFDALHESLRHSVPSFGTWPSWPPAYRTADSPEVAAFASANAERVEFFEYLQWQLDEQLRSVTARARDRGLGVGLELDLAVSVDGGGSESWADQDCYANLASVGAPPDPLNLLGQDWGLPPLVPERLRETGYAPFIATLRENMRGGALRIDHVMWLMRLFWIPAGTKCANGAYVHYPFEDMLGILALESVRNRCLVVGEDLGTVPDEVRRALARLRVLSFRPMFFQREPDGAFSAPRDYPQDSVVTVSTHDLPTLKGFWQGVDLDVRRDLGLFPDEARRETELAARACDRERLLAALEREGLAPEGVRIDSPTAPEFAPELALSVHRFVSRAPARLFLVQLEDVLGQLHQVNLPGTADEYPNWRHKLPLDLEDLPTDPRMQALVGALRSERGASVSPTK